MSLQDVVLAPGIKTGTYTVTRTAQGSYTNGNYTPGTTSQFTIEASIQPQGQGLREIVGPDGQRGDSVKVIFTKTLLLSVPHPDQISYKSETWKVFAVEEWEAFGGIHYRAYMARKKTP